MEPISRRRALQLGLLGLAGVTAGGIGLGRELISGGAADGGPGAGGGRAGRSVGRWNIPHGVYR